jgi:thiamine biosynthesis protein ThiS
MVDISVNGEHRAIPPGQTVAALLGSLGLDPRKVAVERNEAIIARSQYDAVQLDAGDQIEIVHFIGGG